MPPEQALGKSSEIDGQTDVWAAGATFFTLLTGRLVHEGDNAQQLMVKAATTHARSLATVASDVPAPVAQLVDRALAFDKGGGAMANRDGHARCDSRHEPHASLARQSRRATWSACSKAPILTLAHTQHDASPGPSTGPMGEGESLRARPTPIAEGHSRASLRPEHRQTSVERRGGIGGAGLPRRKAPWSATFVALAVGGISLVALAAFELGGRSSHGAAPPSPSAPAQPSPSAASAPVVLDTSPSAITLAPSRTQRHHPPPVCVRQSVAPLRSAAARPAAGVAASGARPTPSAPTQAATPGPKVNCAPPYVIDPAGRNNTSPSVSAMNQPLP